jgi:hypothetical protein
MKITQVPLSVHPSGIHSEHTPEELAAGKTDILLTGSISGAATVNGTIYGLDDAAIAVKPADWRALQLEIHRMHHANGRFVDVPVPDE